MKQRKKTLGLALVQCITATAWGQSSTKPIVATPTVQIVSAPTGGTIRTGAEGLSALDLGHVSWTQPTPFGLNHTKDQQSFSISTNIGLRLDCPSSAAGKRALIRVFLQQDDSRYTVTLDGQNLSTARTILGGIIFCGSLTQHSFQLRVPRSAPAGPVDPNLGFEVTLP